MQHGARAPSQWTIYLDTGRLFWAVVAKDSHRTRNPAGPASRPIASPAAGLSEPSCFMLQMRVLDLRGPPRPFPLRVFFSANCQTQRREPGHGPSPKEASAPAGLYHHSLCMFLLVSI